MVDTATAWVAVPSVLPALTGETVELRATPGARHYTWTDARGSIISHLDRTTVGSLCGTHYEVRIAYKGHEYVDVRIDVPVVHPVRTIECWRCLRLEDEQDVVAVADQVPLGENDVTDLERMQRERRKGDTKNKEEKEETEEQQWVLVRAPKPNTRFGQSLSVGKKRHVMFDFAPRCVVEGDLEVCDDAVVVVRGAPTFIGRVNVHDRAVLRGTLSVVSLV